MADPIDPETLPYRPCVGVMLLNTDNLIFAGQRIDNTAEAWQMPQGGIDDGEEPKEAALRELWEETGVAAEKVELVAESMDWIPYDLPPELLGKIWKGRYRGQKQKWFAARFLGSDADVNIATEHPEFRTWSWMGPEELIEAIVPFKVHVYREVFREFDQLLRR
ncbi:MAG: RNA pyrophosphohydrolase [Pseudomonadota bacterium]